MGDWQGNYHVHDGQEMERVTYVKSVIPSPGLDKWKINLAVKKALAALKGPEAVAEVEAEATKKRDLGTKFHKWAEDWIAGRNPVPDKDIKGHADQFVKWVSTFGVEFIHSELRVVSTRHGYAGTLDLIVRVSGRVLLVDIKTGDAYPDFALQLAAYRHADRAILPNGDEIDMPAVDGCAVLVVKPRSCHFYKYRADEFTHGVFLACLRVVRFPRFKEHFPIVPLRPEDVAVLFPDNRKDN